jgi:transposase
MSQKRVRSYSAEEKAKVALEVLKGEMTLAQISSKYGVHASQIARWKKEALESIVSGFKSKAKPCDTSQDHLIRELYEQIGQITVERDWLKKKSTLFGLGG